LSNERRPATGVRYVLERTKVEPNMVTYEGFAHLPSADIPLCIHVDLPSGTVHAKATAVDRIAESRATELAKIASPLVRAATKAEIAGGLELPRKIVRWRG